MSYYNEREPTVYSWVSCDVINFSGVNSKSRQHYGSGLNVHCMSWPRVS